MKKILTAALALAFLVVGATALAQTSHTESVTKKTGPGPNSKVKTEVVTGKVKKYEPGKEIEIEGPNGNDHDFDLDENATVKGNIAVGGTATVQFTKGDDGKKRVVVLSEGAASAAETHAAHAAGHALPPAGQEGRTHVESTTKREGPGPNTKTKTEVVIGTVKEYEAGDKITVEGPGDKDYSFDLDEQVTVKGAIVKGQKVRVEYTKTDDGTEHVTVLAPVIGRTEKKAKS
jgi:uncharacterized protein YndB with AHSA1/START domain